MGLKLRERRTATVFIVICIPLMLLTYRTVLADPGPDFDIPGGRKISDEGGMDIGVKQSDSTVPEGSVPVDDSLMLAGAASAGALMGGRAMMLRQQEEEEKRTKKGPKGSGSSSSTQGSSGTKSYGPSPTRFVEGRPIAQREQEYPSKSAPTSVKTQLMHDGRAADDEEFPWHEVPGAFVGAFASLPSGIWEGLKEDWTTWRAYFKDPTSAAPSNIAPYLTQFGYDSMGCNFMDINPEVGATVMAAVDFFGLGKIPFTGNLPRGLILESLKHGGRLEGLQEGFKYTSVGQVCALASMALDPSLDKHLRTQYGGQLIAQSSLIAFSMLGPKLIPKLKSGLVEVLDEIKAGTEGATGSLHYMDAEEFIWRQAMYEAVQDSNLEALVWMAEDLDELRNYYDSSELGLILKGRTVKTIKGHGAHASLCIILPSLIEDIVTEEGPILVQLTNLETGEVYSFYKDFHKVKLPEINIPFEIMHNFQLDDEVVVKMRRLPVWEFVNSIEGDESKTISFNKQGVLVVNLGGKEIPIKSLNYDYVSGREIGGMVYVESQVEDIYGNVVKFRVYDNGFGDQRFTMKSGGGFRPIESLEYDAKRDLVDIRYRLSGDRSQRTALFFKELPDEIDLDTGIATEDMIERVRSRDQNKMGEVGEEIAEKFVVETLKAKVLYKPSKVSHHGPDLKLLIDGKNCIVEAKLVTSKFDLERKFVDAISDVCRRFKQSSDYEEGVAFAVYFDQVTGHFEYVYRIVTPETQDTAFRGLYLIKGQITDISQLGIDVGTQNQLPSIQSFAGYPINQSTSSNAQYGRQQMMLGPGQEKGTSGTGRQEESKSAGSSTGAQDTSNSRNSINTQDAVGVGSKQYNIVHSQSKDQQQRSSNQYSEAPAQREQQGTKSDGGSWGTSDTKNKSPTNSQYKDRERTSSSSQSSGTSSNGERQEQKSSKDDSVKTQSTSSNMGTTKTQDTGVGSKQWSLTHSQSKQQGPSNQHAEPPKQDHQVKKSDGGSKAASGNKNTANSQYKGRESSRSSNQSSEPLAKAKQQEQGSRTNDESKTTPVSKSVENPDSKHHTPSPRGGAKPI